MTPSERSQLFDALSELPPQDLDKLLFELNPPRKNIPGSAAPPGNRVKALLDWADSYIGCGLEEVCSAFDRLKQNKLPVAFDFYGYLKFVSNDSRYKDIRELYTETAALLILKAKYISQKDEESIPVVEHLHKFILREPNKIDGKESVKQAEENQIRHAILSGRPGSGKSTTLKRLLLMLAESALTAGEKLIPVFIQLKSDKPILELIEAEFRRAKVGIKTEQVEDWLFEDQLVLLLDGVNEVPSNDRRKALQAFREENLSIPMIFTTRDLAMGGDLPEVKKRLEMRPLSNYQMQSFVEKYLASKGRHDQASRLLGQLRDRLKEIAETPLLLKMLCDIDVFDPMTQQIPQSKGELFRRFDTKFDRLKAEIPVSDDFRRFKSEVLRHLAFCMIQGDSAKPTEAWLTLERSSAEKIIENLLTGRVEAAGQKAKEWLEDLLEHHLLQPAADPREIEFHHQLFQEYYAAEEILARLRDGAHDLREDKRFQHFFLNRLKWTETISLMMSLLGDQDYQLMLHITRLALDVDLLLGAKLAGNVKPAFQCETVGLLFDPKIYKLARIGFFKFPTRLSVPYWLKIKLWQEASSAVLLGKWLEAFESEDSWVRWKAVYGFRYCEPEKVVSTLSKALDDEDKEIWLVAVRSLAHINSSVTLPCLIKAARKEKGSIRGEAIKAIGELRTEKAIPIFHEVLDDDSPVVRHNAVQGLSQLEPTVAVSELTSLTKNRRLFPAVTTFLGQMETEEAFLGLLKVLENDKPSARRYAVEEIGKFASEMAVSSLIHILNHDKDVSVRVKTVHALAKFDGEEVVSALIKALDQEHHSVYLAAAIALIKVEPEKPLSRLYEALSNKNIEVRASAIDSLRDIEADTRFPLLFTVLEDKEPFIRHKAAALLNEIGDRGIDVLHERLNDKDESVRLISALSLAEQGIKAGIQEIILLLEEADSDDQYLISYTKACSALRKLGLENIITNLRELIEKMGLGDNSRLVSQFLPEEVPDLLLFMDGEESLREDTRYLLSKIPSGNMTSGLLSALTHSSETVRSRAANALRERNPHDVFTEAAKTSIRQDNGMIFRSLIEIFPKEFRSSFIDEDNEVQLRAEYSWDSTVAVLSDYTGRRTSASAETIQILNKASKKDNIDVLLRIIRVCSTIVPNQSAPILLQLLSSKHPIVRQTAEEQLGYLGAENFMPELLQIIRNNSKNVREAAIRIVRQSKSKDIAHFMAILLDLLRSPSGPIALSTLKTIQASCQIYNYDIAQLKLTPINKQPWEIGNPIFNIQQVGILNTGPVTNHGDQKGFG